MSAMNFNKQAIRGAAHALLVSAVADELENRGYTEHLSPGRELTEYFPDWESNLIPGWAVEAGVEQVPEHSHVNLVYYILGQVSGFWELDPWLVFYHAGLADRQDEQEVALYRMLMGIEGHGVSLDDDHAEQFREAIAKLTGRDMTRVRVQPQIGSHDDWHSLAQDYITWYFEDHLDESEPDPQQD